MGKMGRLGGRGVMNGRCRDWVKVLFCVLQCISYWLEFPYLADLYV